MKKDEKINKSRMKEEVKKKIDIEKIRKDSKK